jgi:thioredoxin-like negative regulator of GroEL
MMSSKTGRLLVLLAITALGCNRDRSEANPPPAPAVAAAPSPACAKAKQHGTFAWIEDDYASALACAKSKNLPIVLDLWAPWCHTCLSMQSVVFTDASFKPDADKFVFVALDTDRDQNAAAVAKFPPSAWPTFYVIGPDEQVLARFVGAASISQFHAFLDSGRRVKSGDPAGADKHLLAAERALAAKNLTTAEDELEAALAAAPPEWSRRPDALVSLIGTRAKLKDLAGCLELAEKSLDDTGNAASASDFLALAMGCAKEREKAEVDRVKVLRERAIARWQKLVDDASAPLSVDDRSDAMALMRETLESLGDQPRAREWAEKQRALLDATAAKAPTPMAAMTYNWPRAEVYVYLGKPLELVPALEQSAKDLPEEYDPRARLGWIYWKGNKLVEAAKWTDDALKLVYGPRKTRVLAQRADIAKAAGDKVGEKRYREDIVKTLEALPPTQTSPEAIEKAKQAVADLEKPPQAAH